MNVKSRAHRILRPITSYTNLLENPDAQRAIAHLVGVDVYSNLIGLYKKCPDDRQWVVSGEEGMFIENFGDREYITFKQIIATSGPDVKTEVKGFFIHLENEVKLWVLISGVRNGKFYDAFELLRFVNRVIEDICINT